MVLLWSLAYLRVAALDRSPVIAQFFPSMPCSVAKVQYHYTSSGGMDNRNTK